MRSITALTVFQSLARSALATFHLSTSSTLAASGADYRHVHHHADTNVGFAH
jgi:hypothetical protein